MYKSIVLLSATLILITGCDNNNDKSTPDPALQAAISDVITRSQADMVFVEGGEFMMGDFGLLDIYNTNGYIDRDLNTRTLHNVKLNNYSLNRYQITYHDYLIYRQAKGIPLNPFPFEKNSSKNAINNFNHQLWQVLSTDSVRSPQQSQTPVYLPWEAANEYCNWLGEQTGLPYALPTEAQWEYAARNRGQYVIYATDNGEFELGRNLPSYQQLETRAQIVDNTTGGDVFPVGSFPSSPLGFYDMDGNGYEWVKDWFDPNYYKNSPEDNPQGPLEPVKPKYSSTPIMKKVIRSSTRVLESKVTVSRAGYKTSEKYTPEVFDDFYFITARCVVNSPTQIAIKND